MNWPTPVFSHVYLNFYMDNSLLILKFCECVDIHMKKLQLWPYLQLKSIAMTLKRYIMLAFHYSNFYDQHLLRTKWLCSFCRFTLCFLRMISTTFGWKRLESCSQTSTVDLSLDIFYCWNRVLLLEIVSCTFTGDCISIFPIYGFTFIFSPGLM